MKGVNKRALPQVHTGSQSINIEKLKVGKLYTFNLNPNPSDIPSMNGLVEYAERWYKNIKSVINGCGNIAIWMESSPTGKFHFHGVIEIHDIQRFIWFIRIIANENHLEIDTIKDYVTWYEYCTKQSKILKDIFNNRLMATYPIQIINEVSGDSFDLFVAGKPEEIVPEISDKDWEEYKKNYDEDELAFEKSKKEGKIILFRS